MTEKQPLSTIVIDKYKNQASRGYEKRADAYASALKTTIVLIGLEMETGDHLGIDILPIIKDIMVASV